MAGAMTIWAARQECTQRPDNNSRRGRAGGLSLPGLSLPGLSLPGLRSGSVSQKIRGQIRGQGR
jgi:hypothetical protein